MIASRSGDLERIRRSTSILPICDEPIEIFQYLDGRLGAGPRSTQALQRPMSSTTAPIRSRGGGQDFGFSYWVRPDRGEHKKSGNLRYASPDPG